MEHEMKLQPIFFDKIKMGTKVYELRLFDEKRRNIKVGDIIIFKKEPQLCEFLRAKVLDLLHFNSFLEAANCLSLKGMGFEGFSAEETAEVYHSFYSESDEKKFKVLAIKVEVLLD